MKTVLCISATSEILTNLEKLYAAQGKTLLLHGRSETQLVELKRQLDEVSKDPEKNIILPVFDFLNDSGWPTKSKDEMYMQWFNDVFEKYMPDSMIIATVNLKKGSAGLEVNAVAPIKCCEEFIKHAKKDGEKEYSIVYMSSIIAELHDWHESMYSYTKYLMNFYIDSLRQDCSKSNIEVYNIRIGPVNTRLIRDKLLENGWLTALSAHPDDVARQVKAAIREKNYDFYAPSYWGYVMLAYRWTWNLVVLGLIVYVVVKLLW